MKPGSSYPSKVRVQLIELDVDELAAIVQDAVGKSLEYHKKVAQLLEGSVLLAQGICTGAQARRILGNVSETTLLRYRKKGLRCYRPGKQGLYLIEDLVAFVESYPLADKDSATKPPTP